MKKSRIITLVAILILTSATFCRTSAQANEMQTFFYKKYAGITIRVNAINETIPNENLTIKLWYNSTAEPVHIDYLNLTIYGFREGAQKLTLNSTCLLENASLPFNNTGEFEVVAHVPDDVWGVTYAELYLEYSIVDLPLKYLEGFSMTAIRNIRYEELQEKYRELNGTFSLLNQTFWESFGKNLTIDELLSLNETYWELLQNYTTLQGSLNELNNTRVAVGVLAVTTIFFVATTVYLVMRKPKDYW
ncbi:MAG: hypothetical protein QXJ11_03370 [Candidatus Bathyarchaeia archaeon]